MIEVERLAREQRFDYLLIESTGISEPIPVAQTFTFVDAEKGIDLSQYALLDTLVTVVDAFNFDGDFGSIDTVQDRGLNDDEQDRRTIVNLLTDQIEFANVIVLNKCDLVSPKKLRSLKALLQRLNPEARIIEATFGQVPYDQILNTRSFDFEKASMAAGWIKELNGEHLPETEAYGISSFVFRDRRPFHPARFWQYLTVDFPANIVRSKGLFWLASRPKEAINWSQAGGSLRADPAGRWWASLSSSQRAQNEHYQANRLELESQWDEQFGDRHNELVFIGQDLNQEQIIRELKTCLCTDSEIQDWLAAKPFSDPFPKW
jgi:G3E family GTPase